MYSSFEHLFFIRHSCSSFCDDEHEHEQSKRLRELIGKAAVLLPGVSNAAMARQVERLGFDAVYVSGAGMANATAGVPDIGLLTLTEVGRLAGYIAKAVKIPAIVDADTGFGGAENVARTICELERAGLAGGHIEDQEFPKRCGHLAGKSIVDVDEMIGKIKAAVHARRDHGFHDHRADGCARRGRFRSGSGTSGELSRCRRRRDLSRSVAKPGGVQDFARDVEAPLLANMTEFGKSPLLSFRRFASLGYRMVIFPMSAFRVSMKASERFLCDLKEEGTQKVGSTRCKRGRNFTNYSITIRRRKE